MIGLSIVIPIYKEKKNLSRLITLIYKFVKIKNFELIFIDDDGPGIGMESREDVLKPFYRLETSRNKKTGGTGLGLSIANNITLSHGGSLELKKSPLNGLRVKISLPV